MSETAEKKRPRHKKTKQFVQKERAVHVTVYDPYGKVISPEVVQGLLDDITARVLDNDLVVTYTQG